jgi:hypothetical protein
MASQVIRFAPSKIWAVFKKLAFVFGILLSMAALVALIIFLSGRKNMHEGESFRKRIFLLFRGYLEWGKTFDCKNGD